MNSKRLIPAMLLAMALVMFWSFGVKYVYQKMGWALPGEQTEKTMPATAPTTAATAPSQPAAIVSSTPTTRPAQLLAGIVPVPAAQPSEAVLGSEIDKDQNYVLAVHTSSKGAAITGVTLNQ